MDENFGASFSIDISNLKAGLAQANRLMRESESEFRAAAAGMDDWTESSEGLTARTKTLTDQIGIQEKKVSALIQEKQRIIDKMKAEGASNEDIERAIDGVNKQITNESKQLDRLKGDLSKAEKALDEFSDGNNDAKTPAEQLRSTIEKQEKALDDLKEAHLNAKLAYGKNSSEAKSLEKQIDKLSDELEDNKKKLDDTGGAAKEAGGSLEGLKGAAGVAGKAIGALATAAAGVVTAFFGLAEGTRETRLAMGKLETAFTQAGLSAEDAESTMTSLYGVLGDEGKATESAAFLAQYANDEKELAEQTRILTGVFATYGDSIPTEGLAEGISATIAMGETQGVLADALEWQGVNLEEFNESLAACADEQEREALITETLNGLYGEAADAYNEVNADIIAANEAQANLNNALADLGAIAEPIMTTLKNLAADLLKTITPFVELIGDGLKGAFEGTSGAADMLADGISGVLVTVVEAAVSAIPTIIETLVALIPSIIGAINTTLITQVPILLETISALLPELLATLAEWIPHLLRGLVNTVYIIVESLSTILPPILDTIVALVPQLIDMLVGFVPSLLEAAITLLMAIVQALPTIITNLVEALPSLINTIINAVLEAFPLLIEAAISLLMAIVQAIPVIIESLTTALPDIIETIINGVIDALPLLLDAAIQLLMAIVQAIPTIIQALVVDLPNIIRTIVSTLVDSLPELIEAAVTLFMGIIEAIPEIVVEIGRQMPTIITSIVEGLEAGIGDIVSIGGDLIRGLWEGISDMTDWIIGKLEGFGESVLGGIKSFFGIASPSKLIEDEVGENVGLAVGTGAVKVLPRVNKMLKKTYTGIAVPDVTEGGAEGSGGLASASGGVVVHQVNNYSQAHSRYEIYRSAQQTAAAVRLAMVGGVS